MPKLNLNPLKKLKIQHPRPQQPVQKIAPNITPLEKLNNPFQQQNQYPPPLTDQQPMPSYQQPTQGQTPISQPLQQLQNPTPRQPAFQQQQQPSPTLPPPQQSPASNFSIVDQFQNKQKSGEFQQDYLGGLNPELSSQLKQNIQDFASGDAMEANKAANNQALATQIRNMRSQTGGALAGKIGQGGALVGQQQLEQGVLSQLANKGLQEGAQEIDMRKTGTEMGLQLANQQQMAKQFGQTLESGYANSALNEKLAADQDYLQQQGLSLDEAKLKGYTDANGQHVMGTLEIQSKQMEQMLDSQAGKQFASYITANPDSTIATDPALKKVAQDMWSSIGMDGQVPGWWADQRIAAIKNPELTNPIIGTMSMLDEAFQSGDLGNMSPEQYEQFKGEFSKLMVGGIAGVDTSDIGATTTPLGVTATDEPTVQQELKQEAKLDEDFSKFETKLPQKYTHVNLDPKTWEKVGIKDPTSYKDWYLNRGGEEYLTVSNSIDNIRLAAFNSSKFAGSYPSVDSTGDRIGMPLDQALKVKAALSKETGIGEKDLKKSIDYAYDLFKDVPVDISTLFNRYGGVTKKEYEARKSKVKKYIKKKNNFTEKQTDDWYEFFKNTKRKNIHKAFGIDIEYGSTGLKTKDLDYS